MMKARWMLGPVLFLLVSPLIHAEKIETSLSAMHLYSACSDAEKSEYARGFCDGAIDALYSSINEWCNPTTVTHGEVKQQVIDVLLESIPNTSSSAEEVVNKAIQSKWPCS